jgi:dihydrofolate synthase/folylpolyglutamate synthase
LETLFEEIFEKRQGTIRYTLERVKKAYIKLGFANSLAPSILVAGTNGKGSTSGFLAKLFSSSGYRVGLFTSPHLCHFRERIQCSHLEVTDEHLIEEIDFLKTSLGIELYEELSFFEVSLLLALKIFEKEKTEINVIEVGLGGLLDATNIIEPVATTIVSIGYDHQSVLGESFEEIFRQKLGIIRDGVPLFFGISSEKAQEQALNSTLQEALQGKNIELFQKGKDFFQKDNRAIFLDSNSQDVFELPSSVFFKSPILRENFALSFAIFSWYQKQAHLSVDFSLLKKQYEGDKFLPPSLVARFEKFFLELKNGQTQEVYLDVCHNMESLEQTYRSLKDFGILEKYGKIPVFLSILTDKPISSMIEYVKAFGDPLVLFSCSSTRSYNATHVKDGPHGGLPFYESFYEAWKSAFLEKKCEAPILVCGSFFAVGEVLSFIESLSNKTPAV